MNVFGERRCRGDAGAYRYIAFPRFAGIGVFVVMLSACGKPPVGEVAIKIERSAGVPMLGIQQDIYFAKDPQKLIIKNDDSPIVLSRDPGRFNLRYQTGDTWNTACGFEIKPNRVVTITVSMVDGKAKCAIRA